MKKFLAGLLFLAVAASALLFLMTVRAEKNIGQSIREQSSNFPEETSFQFGEVGINPFAASVSLEPVRLERNSSSQSRRYQAANVSLLLSYTDFFKMAIWGLEAGLEQLSYAKFQMNGFSVEEKGRTLFESPEITWQQEGDWLRTVTSLGKMQWPEKEFRNRVTIHQPAIKTNFSFGDEDSTLTFQLFEFDLFLNPAFKVAHFRNMQIQDPVYDFEGSMQLLYDAAQTDISQPNALTGEFYASMSADQPQPIISNDTWGSISAKTLQWHASFDYEFTENWDHNTLLSSGTHQVKGYELAYEISDTGKFPIQPVALILGRDSKPVPVDSLTIQLNGRTGKREIALKQLSGYTPMVQIHLEGVLGNVLMPDREAQWKRADLHLREIDKNLRSLLSFAGKMMRRGDLGNREELH